MDNYKLQKVSITRNFVEIWTKTGNRNFADKNEFRTKPQRGEREKQKAIPFARLRVSFWGWLFVYPQLWQCCEHLVFTIPPFKLSKSKSPDVICGIRCQASKSNCKYIGG